MNPVLYRRLVGLACCVLLAIPAFAEIVQIPVTIGRSGIPHVRVLVNDKPADFLLDTGCPLSAIISSKLAGSGNLSRVGEPATIGAFKDAQLLSGVTVKIAAGAASYRLPASTADKTIVADFAEAFNNFPKGEALDGIIGLSAFEGYEMELDFPRHTLTLFRGKDHSKLYGRPGLASATQYFAVRVQMPVRSASQDLGKPSFRIDTGANNISLATDLIKRLGAQKDADDEVTTITGKANVPAYVVKRLSINGVVLNDARVIPAADNENLLGMPFLEGVMN